ncbi:4-oxalocrotonate tautomerase [Novosphingobium sp. PC22D]|uniref:tautomerase family protein n=1 Tax=Novosphingobium sp. PC22D TaxID=1962403 RepID=UPI000BF12413|nr:tautomerase family protein [Novosphingobium sp. PC22D]PEQ13845.1 4-oxalocrotonate tautomerase [Novosphingobium sp. PC22D]
MPHVVVKLWPGKSEAQKRALSDAIVADVTAILGYGEQSVSVGFEEVPAADWNNAVFGPDILSKWDTLLKQPGYGERPKER